MGQAVEEVGRAVERIDDPARLVGIAGNLPGLFEQEAPVGSCMQQFVIQRPLGALIGFRHEIGRSLATDLQMLDLTEIAAQLRPSLARGAVHDGQQA